MKKREKGMKKTSWGWTLVGQYTCKSHHHLLSFLCWGNKSVRPSNTADREIGFDYGWWIENETSSKLGNSWLNLVEILKNIRRILSAYFIPIGHGGNCFTLLTGGIPEWHSPNQLVVLTIDIIRYHKFGGPYNRLYA